MDAEHDEADDPADQLSEWFQMVMMWPFTILMFTLKLIGRFSKLAVLLSFGALSYHQIYVAVVPPSLAESHPINFVFPEVTEERRGGLPANATVDFSFQRQLDVRNGKRGMDWSSGQASGSSLDIGVSFILPESPSNIDLGTFMVHMDVMDKQGKVVGSGSRSVVMYHKSSILNAIQTLAWSVPLILGFTHEQQTIATTVLQLMHFPAQGLHSARVSLSDSRLRVYSASVDITFVLVGFRYYMYTWYFTCLFFGTLTISNIYLALLRWLGRQMFGPDASPPPGDEDGSSPEQRRKSKRRSAGSAGRRSEGGVGTPKNRFEVLESDTGSETSEGGEGGAPRGAASDGGRPGGPRWSHTGTPPAKQGGGRGPGEEEGEDLDLEDDEEMWSEEDDLRGGAASDGSSMRGVDEDVAAIQLGLGVSPNALRDANLRRRTSGGAA